MIGAIADVAVDLALRGAAAAFSRLPKNEVLWAYTITAKDGRTPYMTRVILPRVFGWRPMLHRIWIADQDRDPHSHPWSTAYSIVLTGGYVEERLIGVIVGDGSLSTDQRIRTALTIERIDGDDFHRISYVAPRTWTLFVAGPRHPDGWGFLTVRGYVDFETYFRERGIAYQGVRS